jgi:RNA polymerase sigma factor (sigma-70 family)
LCLALESLDGRSRELIRLKLGENMSYQQISACTGLPTGHVGHLLHQALKAVATELARGGMVP